MPEGDTIHRAARSLRAALAGADATEVSTPRLVRATPAPGTRIEDVEARGKHLLVHFADGRTLHTHMRMTGSWHVYGPQDRWRKSSRSARAIIRTDEAVAVCFSAPVVEIVATDALQRHTAIGRLGPDLCLADPDLGLVVARARELRAPDDLLGDVLLDQRVACGIGNVYRSEALWAHEVHPRTPLGAVDDDRLARIYRWTAGWLRRNLELPRRTTVRGAPAGTVAVYDRAGRPCRRCGTPVEVAHEGRDVARVSYWCPTCQPEPGLASDA